MSKLKKRKMTVIEKRLLQELVVSQEVKLGCQKHENLGFSDTPLFSVKQSELF